MVIASRFRLAWILLAVVSLSMSTATAGWVSYHWFYRMWDLLSGPQAWKEPAALAAQKSFHVAIFGGLGWAASKDRDATFGAVMLCGLLLAVLSELLQMLSASRSPQWQDVLLNAGALGAGGWVSRRRG